MSNENKTALTAEEILKKHSENSAKCKVIYNKTHEAIIDAMQEFASLQTEAKDKEIEELKSEIELLKAKVKLNYALLQSNKVDKKEKKDE